MATQALLQCVYVGSTLNAAEPLFRGGPEELWCKEAASQTSTVLPAGALCYLSSGLVTVATATSSIAGQVMTAGTGVTNASIQIRVIRPDDIYMMQLNGTTNQTTTIAELGNIYGIKVNSTLFNVDRDVVETTGGSGFLGRVKVIGFPSLTPDGVANTIGDTNGWYYVRFIERSHSTDTAVFKQVLQLA